MEPQGPRDYWVLVASSIPELENKVRMQCKLDDWVPLGGMIATFNSGNGASVFYQTIVTPAMINRENETVKKLADLISRLLDELAQMRSDWAEHSGKMQQTIATLNAEIDRIKEAQS